MNECDKRERILGIEGTFQPFTVLTLTGIQKRITGSVKKMQAVHSCVEFKCMAEVHNQSNIYYIHSV